VIQQRSQLPVGTIIRGMQNKAYTVEGILGQGGFSSVYLVRDQFTGQHQFALKELITPKSQEKLHLTFEAEVLMRLDHPSLPHIYEVFEETSSNHTYLLMDYIKGKNLETLREEQANKRYPLIFVIVLMSPIVEAISYLHSQQPPIVHRDIKPANIIVPTESRDAFLVDFGLAKEYIKDKTTNIFRYGTPGYAAPEQYGQGTSLQTDVYGLAATIYTLLTGTVPPDAITRSFNKRASDPLKRADQLSPTIPAAIGKILTRALSLQPEKRYASVDNFWKEFIMTAEISAIGGHETRDSLPQTIISPLPPLEPPTRPSPTQPVTPLLVQLTTTPLAAQRSPVRQSRRPALPILLRILILIVLGIAIGSLSWLFLGSHNTSPTTSTRHHTSVVSTETCIPSQTQIASCSSPVASTPSTTSATSSKNHSTSPIATPTLAAAHPTLSSIGHSSATTTPTPSATNHSSPTTTPTPSTTSPTPSTVTPTPSTTHHSSPTTTPTPPTATPTSSAANSILSAANHAPSAINIQVP
jgi:serine/threonine protein kinase